jgi:hypothetical protein
MLPLSRIAAKDGSRYAIKIDSEALEYIRCTIDDGFHQGGEYSAAAVYRLVPGDQIGNYIEGFQFGKPDGYQYGSRDNEAYR